MCTLPPEVGRSVGPDAAQILFSVVDGSVASPRFMTYCHLEYKDAVADLCRWFSSTVNLEEHQRNVKNG